MITLDAGETQNFGRKLAETLKSGDVVALFGDLGTGKTTLTKGIVEEMTQVRGDEVQSPTFTTLNIYDSDLPLYHFDLYRLKNKEEFISKGFLDYLAGPGICVIEWPERIGELLPKNAVRITLKHLEEGKRTIDVQTS